MLRKVELSQEAVELLIIEHQYLHAQLRGDSNNAYIFQQKLARYDGNQMDGYWTEIFDTYQKVKKHNQNGKIQRHEGVKR